MSLIPEMASQETIGDFGAPQSGFQKSVCSTAKHCKTCRVAVKDHFGPHGEGKCVFSLLSALQDRIGKLEETLELNEKRHEKDLAEQAAMYEERMNGMLALIESLHDQQVRGGESYAKTAADVSLSPGEGKVGEHEKASAIAVDQRQGDVVTVQPPILPAVSMCVPDDTGEVGSATGSPRARAERVKYADRIKIPYSGEESCNEDKDDGFITVERRNKKKHSRWQSKPSMPQHTQSTTSQRKNKPQTLKGAERVRTQKFHLAGISPECSPSDVIEYCRKRNVVITGCYFIHTRVWGTQSAKLFVDEMSGGLVLSDNFWPSLVKCRKWEREPPRNITLETPPTLLTSEAVARGHSTESFQQ